MGDRELVAIGVHAAPVTVAVADPVGVAGGVVVVAMGGIAVGVAVAVEENAAGEIYPAVYVASGGAVTEHLLDPQPLHDFRGAEYQRRLTELL